MAQRVCPWWIGRLMVSPIRRWMNNPEKLLQPHVCEGMTVLEPGPGMGFFTLPIARMVGSAGRVIAVDVQTKMLEGLRRRAERAGLLARMELRLAEPQWLGVEDLIGQVDLVVAIAVVHEMLSDEGFFREAALTLKPDGRLLLIEPRGHVKPEKFTHELQAASHAGLLTRQLRVGGASSAAVLAK